MKPAHRPLSSVASFLALSLAAATLGACGGGGGGAEPDEWTGSTTQGYDCASAGIRPESCGGGVGGGGSHPLPLPAPVAPAFPATVACPSGTTCTFEASSGVDLSSLPCSGYEWFKEVTATATTGYKIAFCNTVGVGISEIDQWIAANPSLGASLQSSAPGLPAAPAGYSYLVFDADPTGPVFPTPVACPSGDTCTFTPEPGFDIPGAACSETYAFAETSSSGSSTKYLIAYCSTSGQGAAELNAWIASVPNYHPSLQYAPDGLPPVSPASGYVYVEFTLENIGVHCGEQCE